MYEDARKKKKWTTMEVEILNNVVWNYSFENEEWDGVVKSFKMLRFIQKDWVYIISWEQSDPKNEDCQNDGFCG